MVSYQELMDISNATILALFKALKNFGINNDLIWNEMSFTFRELLNNSSLVFSGTSVKELTEEFGAKMKEIGLCEVVNIHDVDESHLVIGLGKCIFASACRAFAQKDPQTQPPCPMIAILYGRINQSMGKTGQVVGFKNNEEDSTEIFTIELSEQ